MLAVCAAGMDERSRYALRIFFERHLGGKCVLVSEEMAQVALIDADGYKAADAIADQRTRYPKRPMVLLTLTPQQFVASGAITIQKPVRTEVLFATFEKLRREQATRAVPVTPLHATASDTSRLGEVRPCAKPAGAVGPSLADKAAARLGERERHFYVGSLPDVDFDRPDELAKIFYDPGDFLQGHVKRAIDSGIANGSVVRVSSPAFGGVDIYPFASCAVLPHGEAALSAASRIPLDVRSLRVDLLGDAPQLPPEDVEVVALDSLRWKLALWASRGRVPRGTDLDSPVVLNHWPNLTRLLVPPHAPRILGLWARNTHSLKATSKILMVLQRNVFGLYSACLELDAVTPPTPASNQPVQTEPEPLKPSEKHGLFRMLLKNLTGSLAN
jgi:hypothetical protein